MASKSQDKTNEGKPDETDVSQLAFEQAMKELEEIVSSLEGGSVSLEDSIKLYERGEKLKARCEALLKSAEARIEKINLSAEGKPKGVTPLDAE